MFNFINTNTIFSTIKRNENVYIFYSGTNVFSFACIYLIYKYFQSQTMLDKVKFIPVESDKDFEAFDTAHKDRAKMKNCRYFFIDCDLDKWNLFSLIKNCLSTHVIDSKPTVAHKLMSQLTKLPGLEKFNISFHTSKDVTFVGVVWKLLTSENPPDFIHGLNLLYLNPLSDVFGTNPELRILTKIKPDFQAWDYHFDNPILDSPVVYFHAATEFKEALDIGRRNSFHANVFSMDTVAINCNKYMMQHLATMCFTQRIFDTAILFERTEHGYYYQVHTLAEHDLLNKFKAFNPHGFKNKIHFTTHKDILVKKPTVMQRLFGH